MPGRRRTSRRWIAKLPSGEARLRCSFQKLGKQIEKFVVQLEIRIHGDWQPIARYDNAHGFCHRDTLHIDGTQEKTRVFVGDANQTLTYGIEDFRDNWLAYRSRFLEGES